MLADKCDVTSFMVQMVEDLERVLGVEPKSPHAITFSPLLARRYESLRPRT